MTYNGWTNKETHMVNHWASESLADYIEYAEYEGYYKEVTADSYRDFVIDMLETSASNPQDALAQELIAHALDSVNWQELADAFNG